MDSIPNHEHYYRYTSLFLNRTQSSQFVATIMHWQKHHGLLWTVEKIKALKAEFLQFLANGRVGKKPKGSFKCVWSLSDEKALQLLNIYTTVTFTALQPRQYKKFKAAVEGPPIGDSPPVKVTICGETLASCWSLLNKNLYVTKPIMDYHRSSSKFAPLSVRATARLERVTTVRETDVMFSDMWKFRPDPDTSFFCSKFVKDISDAMRCSTSTTSDKILFDWTPESGFNHDQPVVDPVTHKVKRKPPMVGTVHLLQERGGKLRHIANPFRVWQAVLGPLADFIGHVNHGSPWDCTHDQDRGIRFVRESLNKGCTIFSIDLSSATDRFPLEIQVQTMNQLVGKLREMSRISARHIRLKPTNARSELLEQYQSNLNANLSKIERLLDIFAQLARGRWAARLEGSNEIISWTVGQPLGLIPSFGIFAFVHGQLLNTISRELGVDGAATFRVLGDDVVVNDRGVAEHYLQVIRSIGVEVSPTKTLVSNRVGEFAGRVVGPKGPLRVYKFSASTTANPAGPLFSLGSKAIDLVKAEYRRLVTDYAGIPEPIGLGLNPKGLPLADRVTDEYVRHVLQWEKPPKAEAGTFSKRDRHWYNLSFWLPLINRDGYVSYGEYLNRNGSQSLPDLGSRIKRDSSKELVAQHINEANKSAYVNYEQYLSVPEALLQAPKRGRMVERAKHPNLLMIKRLVKKLRQQRLENR